MRLLVIDPYGDGLDVALRAQSDGHSVKLFLRADEKTKFIGKGLVPVVNDFKPWLEWADLIFNVDNTLYLRDMDGLRSSGHTNIVGPTQEAARWEMDRRLGQEIFRKHGIPTVEFKEFNDYDDAIAYVKKEDRRFVSKPSDEADKAMSYMAKSPEDLIYMLERWKKLGKMKAPFILQEFVPGTEMAVGGFMGPHGFNAGWCENFEFKKFMNNDLGIATGEQGTVLRFVEKSKLANRVLKPLTDTLRKLKYVGYIDVNCIIDDKGNPWPLEFTMRFGWPTYNIQLSVLKGDSAQWLLDLTMGVDSSTWMYDTIAVGVVMSIPDYPYSHATKRETAAIPIYGLKPSLWKHVHPCEMMLGENLPLKIAGRFIRSPLPATAGDYVLVMTALADNVRDAANTAYRRLENLTVPNSPMYRTDIGRRLGKQLPKIQPHGYATGMLYSRND